MTGHATRRRTPATKTTPTPRSYAVVVPPGRDGREGLRIAACLRCPTWKSEPATLAWLTAQGGPVDLHERQVHR